MFPLKSNISLDRGTSRGIYLQIGDQIINLIKDGKLAGGTRLPGTRQLAMELGLHRQTVVAAYEELSIQGWIESIPSKGTFVHRSLPITSPRVFSSRQQAQGPLDRAAFSFTKRPNLKRTIIGPYQQSALSINDGDPDSRLAPVEDIARHYRSILRQDFHKKLLAYGPVHGNLKLREALVDYLGESRGLRIKVDNLLITRGSQMGIYIASQLLLTEGKKIVIGDTNYRTADITFQEAGAELIRVAVDEEGLDTTAMEEICKSQAIQAVFVTSHHHHPTTVTLSAERRMHLLQLAQQYHFAIIEDDYDYNFHYSNAPILPLASNDRLGNVLYIGGFTKIIAPAIRIGYLVGPKDFIEEAARLRRIIDRQGDQILEQVLARMLRQGDVQRHINKVQKVYKERRDLFCTLFSRHLHSFFEFEIPKGGLSIWAKLKAPYEWEEVYKSAHQHGLFFNNHWQRYDAAKAGHQGIRIGFAAYNVTEAEAVILRLKQSLSDYF